MEGQEDGGRARPALRWVVLGVVVGVALIAWLVTRGDGGDGGTTAAPLEAQIVSEEELVEIAAERGHSVYWAGPVDGKELEAGEIEGGGIQVTYVEKGAEPGGDKGGRLTIGSYPLDDPAEAHETLAGQAGAIVRSGKDGTVVSNAATPNSVYLAGSDGSVQVEVYDPVPSRAMALARSGRVKPIE